ncbi:uncharacterized protein LOC122507637 [Leptopilina heterotoma]|uniref:uncharacterized protein LOC122507637 n=1 Tax=Leptopilina heterotoma TaxID=63436 RepID=UPI001CA97BBB|nr:uncharacterized protein LOC122507637 [Leptopilina heterotoma]
MDSSNFVLLNGRSPSDTPANFSFTGAQGHSVFDKVWCSCDDGLSLFCDLQVLQLPTLSDHLPVTVLFADHYSGVYQSDGDDGLRFHIFRAEAFTRAMEWSGEVSHLNGDVVNLNSTLTSTIKNVAKNLGMTRPPRHGRLISNNKPWFDRECRDAKRRVFLKLKRAKANNLSKESKLNFLKEKRNYRSILKSKKRTYRDLRINKVANCRNSSEFWKIVNSSRGGRCKQGAQVGVATWTEYLHSCYPVTPMVNVMPELRGGPFNLLLDSEITFEEVMKCIAHSKKGKQKSSEVSKSISSARMVVGGILKSILSLGMDSWNAYTKLFQSLAVSGLFYGVQVWGIRHLDQLEKVQLIFYKKLLLLPLNTPDYAVRVETGAVHLGYGVLSLILSWIQKISRMESSRYPRKCFERLRALSLNNIFCDFNWFTQLRVFFEDNDLNNIWSDLSLDNIETSRGAILERYGRRLRSLDESRCAASSSLCIYPCLPIHPNTQPY